MSNNKQSSIDWLYNKMYEHRGNITIEEFEQAKAMHKEEIIKFATDFFFWWYNETSGTNTCEAVQKYYNETFGGNNENNI